MPDFYNHIGYIDDHGMPHPPLDDEEEEEEDGDISFPPVAERSLSPDAAFEYTKSKAILNRLHVLLFRMWVGVSLFSF